MSTPFEVATDADLRAHAYVYCGEWVADCPRPGSVPGKPGCSNAEFLYQASRLRGPRDQVRPFFHCSYCGFQAPIIWPRNREAIMMALAVRPVPDNRNWYPTDHPVAIRFRLPHGQSIADLLAENEEHGISNEPIKGLR